MPKLHQFITSTPHQYKKKNVMMSKIISSKKLLWEKGAGYCILQHYYRFEWFSPSPNLMTGAQISSQSRSMAGSERGIARPLPVPVMHSRVYM